MTKEQLSAQELRRNAEKEKIGKESYGFGRTSAEVTVCDLITLLTAGGELIQVNKVRNGRRVKDYLHFVKYQGYQFYAETEIALPEGILDREYTQGKTLQATIEQSLKWKRFYHAGDEKPYTITKFDMNSKKLEIGYAGGEHQKVNLENHLADHSVD